MTKAELIESVASKVDLPRAIAERAVNTMFDEMTAALKQGDKVNISGFGTFSVSTRKARTGRNPKTGREHRDRRLARGEVQTRQDAQGRSQQRKPLAARARRDAGG